MSTFSNGFGDFTPPLTCEAKYLSFAIIPGVREFVNGVLNIPMIGLAAYGFYNSSLYYKGFFNSLISFSFLSYAIIHSLYCFFGREQIYHFRTVLLFWFMCFQCLVLTDLVLNKHQFVKTFALLCFMMFMLSGMFMLSEWHVQNFPIPLIVPIVIIFGMLMWVYRRRTVLVRYSCEFGDNFMFNADALDTTRENPNNIRRAIKDICWLTGFVVCFEFMDEMACFAPWCAYIPFSAFSELVRGLVFYNLSEIAAFINSIMMNQLSLIEIKQFKRINVTWLSRHDGRKLDVLEGLRPHDGLEISSLDAPSSTTSSSTAVSVSKPHHNSISAHATLPNIQQHAGQGQGVNTTSTGQGGGPRHPSISSSSLPLSSSYQSRHSIPPDHPIEDM